MELPTGGAPPQPDDDEVPIFGTWRGIYTAVILVALLWMGLIRLFSGWPW